MGERKPRLPKALNVVTRACQEMVSAAAQAEDTDMRVRTPGDVYSVRWDEPGGATALGQLAFFAEYLQASGLFDAWLKSCPLSYTSPNAP